MKTLLISSLIAVSSVFTFAAPSFAQGVTVTTTERVVRQPVRDEYRPRHHQRGPRDCYVKKVRTHHHGRVVIKETRVCR
ncbi:hypothetical protein [Agrobacterium rubi]|uniref:Uncharacterized protein n=2 Tax=Agrobacterium rubi TaxID=28099 RepID=A0AAE7UM93_9HYPH|nr:hypothetical protein [Agrobacterium rubi]MBP1877253.1 hypothetical protein [Agrobacterium rubi]MCL6651436.1 hypothetical protein [Agrobacterium rubi]NTE87111.1 hypothetical protein [Agrobacterium rubi]NTF03045.1 hypothetical protein [Agrobacterium rubi]NTF08244.1 hypothetical protein [Agrobacterium rubi]